MNKFSERLKELRLENHLTQLQLGISLGFGRSSVSDWESRGREPNFDALLKISKFFNVSTDYLLGVSDF